MAEDFNYEALWSIARDALDAANGLTSAILGLPRPPIDPRANSNPRPGTHEKWETALKALPERRAKAIDAIHKAAEKLAKLLAEDRFVAPLAGVWPPSTPEIARRLSIGLGMAAGAVRAVVTWKDGDYIDQPKRYAVDAGYTLLAVVGELERRQDVAALAYQRQVEKLRAEHPDWSAADAMVTWCKGDGKLQPPKALDTAGTDADRTTADSRAPVFIAGDGGAVAIKGGGGGPGRDGAPVNIAGDGAPVLITGGAGGSIIVEKAPSELQPEVGTPGKAPAVEDQAIENPDIPDRDETLVLNIKGKGRAILKYLWKRGPTSRGQLRQAVWGQNKIKDRSIDKAIDDLNIKLTQVIKTGCKTEVIRSDGMYLLQHPQK